MFSSSVREASTTDAITDNDSDYRENGDSRREQHSLSHRLAKSFGEWIKPKQRTDDASLLFRLNSIAPGAIPDKWFKRINTAAAMTEDIVKGENSSTSSSAVISALDYVQAATRDLMNCHDQRIPSLLRALYREVILHGDDLQRLRINITFNMINQSFNKLYFFRDILEFAAGAISFKLPILLPLTRGVRATQITIDDVFHDLARTKRKLKHNVEESVDAWEDDYLEDSYYRIARSAIFQILLEYCGNNNSSLFREKREFMQPDELLVRDYVHVGNKQTSTATSIVVSVASTTRPITTTTTVRSPVVKIASVAERSLLHEECDDFGRGISVSENDSSIEVVNDEKDDERQDATANIQEALPISSGDTDKHQDINLIANEYDSSREQRRAISDDMMKISSELESLAERPSLINDTHKRRASSTSDNDTSSSRIVIDNVEPLPESKRQRFLSSLPDLDDVSWMDDQRRRLSITPRVTVQNNVGLNERFEITNTNNDSDVLSTTTDSVTARTNERDNSMKQEKIHQYAILSYAANDADDMVAAALAYDDSTVKVLPRSSYRDNNDDEDIDGDIIDDNDINDDEYNIDDEMDEESSSDSLIMTEVSSGLKNNRSLLNNVTALLNKK